MNSRNDPDASASEPNNEPPVGWLDPEVQHHIEWRDGDVVVSVPVKSGTTWTMNIVHQLRTGGDPDFADIYVEVPWLELKSAPNVTREERIAKFDGMPRDRRRAFKTHSAPGPLPYHEPSKGVKYVVVARHPDEAIASMRPFIAAHSDAWFDLWQTPREAFVRPTFESFFYEVGQSMIGPMIFGFVAAWWPLRNNANVLLMHYTDMKRDHEGSVRKIARFLDFHPSAEEWPTILECTSFPWMKAREDRFELHGVTDVPILNPGAMMRKGKAGAAHEDGVTPAISADIARLGREIVTDPAALAWCYRGGPVPS